MIGPEEEAMIIEAVLLVAAIWLLANTTVLTWLIVRMVTERDREQL